MSIQLIADSGSTKADWCLVEKGRKKKTITTQGISPYFLTGLQMEELLSRELLPHLKKMTPDQCWFYGTGCSNPAHVRLISKVLKRLLPGTTVHVHHDLLGAARALCGHEPGVACILGTGSNSCYYNGKKIVKNSPGLGFILGDEGSGAYLGRKVIQHYLYQTFDPDLMDRFNVKFNTSAPEILEAVYKGPLPNRYLAAFTGFLAENRGHYMIENIIEDSFNDFFFTHLYKYNESWTHPIHFIGSVAYGFRDVLKEICANYELQLGRVLKHPLDGLLDYHSA